MTFRERIGTRESRPAGPARCRRILRQTESHVRLPVARVERRRGRGRTCAAPLPGNWAFPLGPVQYPTMIMKALSHGQGGTEDRTGLFYGVLGAPKKKSTSFASNDPVIFTSTVSGLIVPRESMAFAVMSIDPPTLLSFDVLRVRVPLLKA